jgi:hypothetical protein
MDTISAFVRGEASRGKEQMVFDWDKAARLIIEHKATSARAGLSGDWEWTSGYILTDGMPDRTSYTFLASTWAIPEIEIDGVIYDCYRMASQSDGWNSETKWPDSAVAILTDIRLCNGDVRSDFGGQPVGE